MGKTISEKILAKVCTESEVSPGEVVLAKPDLIITPAASFPAHVKEMKKLGFKKVKNPEKVFVTVDHVVPPNEQLSDIQRECRKIVKSQGIHHFFDIGYQAISHQLLADKGIVQPGVLILAGDTRGPTYGAFGAYSTAVPHDLPSLLATGKIWLKVPETLRIEIEGVLKPWVMSRDVIQWLISQIGVDKANFRAIEFYGSMVENMEIDDRMTICNVSTEIGVTTAIVPPDKITASWIGKKSSEANYSLITSDKDAEYSESLSYNVSNLEPQIALPPKAEKVESIKELEGTKIDQGYIGSCASGRLTDLRMAAKIMRKGKVAKGVRLLVYPSSQYIYKKAIKEGLIERLIKSGAVIGTPCCGPCTAVISGKGWLTEGETCLATATSNASGRMGSKEAKIYLSSAATVAASAIEGRITNPEKFF